MCGKVGERGGDHLISYGWLSGGAERRSHIFGKKSRKNRHFLIFPILWEKM
jgi:hypothetical protein